MGVVSLEKNRAWEKSRDYKNHEKAKKKKKDITELFSELLFMI